MKPLRYGLSGLGLGLMVALASPAAADDPSAQERAEEMARGAIEQMMRALELMMDAIPQYDMPELNENGDIIIRRKRKPSHDQQAEPEFDETKV
jgi:hypothetical protein